MTEEALETTGLETQLSEACRVGYLAPPAGEDLISSSEKETYLVRLTTFTVACCETHRAAVTVMLCGFVSLLLFCTIGLIVFSESEHQEAVDQTGSASRGRRRPVRRFCCSRLKQEAGGGGGAGGD